MVTRLVIETAGACCSVALLGDRGDCIARQRAEAGRGHAERLIPLIAALPGGGCADAVLVDCGPGSFTGVRIGVAAARALALGWQIPASGYSSLALLAAIGFQDDDCEELSVVIEGGHGDVFVQSYRAAPFGATTVLTSLPPEQAARGQLAHRLIGNAAHRLALLRGHGDSYETELDAAAAALLPPGARGLPALPIYGRNADAVPR